MKRNDNRPSVPLGLGYALAENANALKVFSNMTEQQRGEVIEQTRAITSKAAMRSFVEKLNVDN